MGGYYCLDSCQSKVSRACSTSSTKITGSSKKPFCTTTTTTTIIYTLKAKSFCTKNFKQGYMKGSSKILSYQKLQTRIHERLMHSFALLCCFFFVMPSLLKNWFATWGLKLDSKDAQGRVGMKIEVNMVQSLPMETPNISFSNMRNIFLNTFCYLHVYVIYFCSFVCFVSRSMVFKNQFSIVLF